MTYKSVVVLHEGVFDPAQHHSIYSVYSVCLNGFFIIYVVILFTFGSIPFGHMNDLKMSKRPCRIPLSVIYQPQSHWLICN